MHLGGVSGANVRLARCGAVECSVPVSGAHERFKSRSFRVDVARHPAHSDGSMRTFSIRFVWSGRRLSSLFGGLLILPLAFLFSCQSAPPPSEAEPETEVLEGAEEAEPIEEAAALPRTVGRIVVLGAENRFVVIKLDGDYEPAVGSELSVVFAGRDVARLRVSPERQSGHITADVLRGTVERGYLVQTIPD